MSPAQLAVVPRPNETLHPDISWMKKNVPVLEVAKALGMRIRRSRAQCWRPENHTHGDADPSLCFHGRRNRARCFVCDMRGGHSNVDLVMGVLGVDVGSAALWIAERFCVPSVKCGRPQGSLTKQPAPYRIGVRGSELEVLVRSGMFGQLSAPERSIVVALHEFRDPDSGLTRMSYRAIMRYSGIAGWTTLSKALSHLQRLHLIQVHQGARIGVRRECSVYRVTLEDEKFLERCNEIYNRSRKEIEQERMYRKQLRNDRQRRSRPEGATSGGSMVQEESCSTFAYTNLAGGQIPPAPLSERQHLPREKNTGTCTGLNLSPTTGVKSNKALLAEEREIGVSQEMSGLGGVAGDEPDASSRPNVD